MSDPATARRTAAALGLVGVAVLTTVSVYLDPAPPQATTALLQHLAQVGPRGELAIALFTLAQLPFFAAVLGIGHLLRRGAPRLATVGAAFGVVGAFGHAVWGGASLSFVAMAHDQTHRDVFVPVVNTIKSSPPTLFSLAGLIGTVVGILLLSIGLLRAHVGPRWVPPVLWAFLLIEFLGAAITGYASLVSTVLGAVAFLTLARVAIHSPRALWTNGHDATTHTADAPATA